MFKCNTDYRQGVLDNSQYSLLTARWHYCQRVESGVI